jgi:hypothetical protein
MLKGPPASALPGQLEYLLPGCNALETSLHLAQSWTWLNDTLAQLAMSDRAFPLPQ